MRREGRKQKLADLLEVMDFKNFGIMEINFRKCLCVTSIKGVNFFMFSKITPSFRNIQVNIVSLNED